MQRLIMESTSVWLWVFFGALPEQADGPNLCHSESHSERAQRSRADFLHDQLILGSPSHAHQ